jgi:hypothetical protein
VDEGIVIGTRMYDPEPGTDQDKHELNKEKQDAEAWTDLQPSV